MCIRGRIILKRILNKKDMGMWTGFIWFRIGTSIRVPFIPLKQRSGSIKDRESDHLSNY
jgi:hypothetical protein